MAKLIMRNGLAIMVRCYTLGVMGMMHKIWGIVH